MRGGGGGGLEFWFIATSCAGILFIHCLLVPTPENGPVMEADALD